MPTKMEIAEEIDSLLCEEIPTIVNVSKRDLMRLKTRLEKLLCTNANVPEP